MKLGQDVTLPCDAGEVTITAVEWTRSDMVDKEYVLFYSDGHSDPTYQHSSFKDRVQLVDGELKDGDVSLILKNVRREDVGTYECRVQTAGSRRKKRATIKTQPISRVQLQVTGECVSVCRSVDMHTHTVHDQIIAEFQLTAGSL